MILVSTQNSYCESGGWKGCTDWVGHVFTPLLGAIELTILCAFICIVEYFNAQIRDTLMYK